MTSEEEIKSLQDEAWQAGKETWGADRYGVMNYLQAEWEKNEFTKALDYNQENIFDTAEAVLDYWYQEYPYKHWYGKKSGNFMIWLYDKYKEYRRKYLDQRFSDQPVHGTKLNPPDHRPLPPRKKSLYCIS